MRGEYWKIIYSFLPLEGSPPLARGVQSSALPPHPSNRITPACAGSTIVNSGMKQLVRDHPRLRGEYFIELYALILSRGITPACAGSTFHLCGYSRYFRDHPRLRGEYKSGASERSYKLGSPPLARGVPEMKTLKENLARITPACAGSTY